MTKMIGFVFLVFVCLVSGRVWAFQEEPLLPAGVKPRGSGSATIPVPTQPTLEDQAATPSKATPPSKTKPPAKTISSKSAPPKAAAAPKSRQPEVPPDIDVIREQERVITYANSHLANLRYRQYDCTECYVSSAGGDDSYLGKMTDSKRDCVDKWTDFYNTGPLDPNDPDGPNKPVDLRIVLGYLDEEVDSFVSDAVMRQSMVQTLTAPCEANNFVRACGFKVSSADEDVFEKEVTNPQGKPQKVRLTLKSSSSPAGALSKANPEVYSAAAEKTYFDGIKEADMLLYVGHARGGGGPDFRPAVRRANGKIDYEYYENKEPGLKAMDAAFSRATVDGKKKTPKIMGFFACNANIWKGRMQKNAPNSGLIFSRAKVIDIQRMLGMAYLTLDSVLWQRCKEEFDRALNTLIDYRKTKLDPLDLENFFGKSN